MSKQSTSALPRYDAHTIGQVTVVLSDMVWKGWNPPMRKKLM